MHSRNPHTTVDLLHAVDGLAIMAELELKTGGKNLETFVENREKIKGAFKTLLSYLKFLEEKEPELLTRPEVQKGMHGLMLLVAEVALKVDQASGMIEERLVESITQVKEYQELQEFYLRKIASRFVEAQMEDESVEYWEKGRDLRPDDRCHGLKYLIEVKEDKNYELFLIRKEDGSPFFNRSLLSHIQMVGDFEETLMRALGQDPFSKLHLAEDRNFHMAAREILHRVAPYIDEYYKEALKHKRKAFVSAINKALMAVMLAANAHNLAQNTTSKACSAYYRDFQTYLRAAISAEEYQAYLESSSRKADPFTRALLNICHHLCVAFFLRSVNFQELMTSIRELIFQGEEKHKKGDHAIPFWNELLQQDQGFRERLEQYPNGPLLQTVALFRGGNALEGFDPLAQKNFPNQLYTILGKGIHIGCIRLPCPTSQKTIDKVEIVPEFIGFLDALKKQNPPSVHLLINLQDITSYQESGRFQSLEGCLEELQGILSMISIPKQGEFYLQIGSYATLEDADAFLSQFHKQLLGGKLAGYSFPSSWKKEEQEQFISELLPMIHALFFEGKSKLSHRSRLDFIEVFALFLVLKIIDLYQPDTISFTCKDGIDTGAVAAAGFYSFLKVMNGQAKWSKDEKDQILWMLYSSALTLHHRAVEQTHLHRMISALALIDTTIQSNGKGIKEKCSALYRNPFFQNLSIET